jgi:hypothetical protein
MTRVKTAVLFLAGIAAGCGGGGGGGAGQGGWRSYATPPGTLGISALWASAPNDVWASGQTLLHFDGTAFTAVSDAPIVAAADFWGFAPDDLYAVSGPNLAHWDGTAWTLIDFAGAIDPSGLTAVWGTSGGDLWLGDELNGQVFHWDGTAWSTGITQTVSVTDLWGAPGAGGAVYAGGVFGLARWSDAAWTDIGDDVAMEAAALWGFADDDVWVVSDFGTLAHWTGTSWTDTLPAGNADFQDGLTSIWGAAPDDVWAVGDFGAISHWDGAQWTQIEYGQFPYYPFLSKVHGSSADDVWIAGRSANGNNAAVILHKGR